MENRNLKPIVLVGGGENHYRLIHSLTEEIVKNRPIILVTKNNKYFSNNLLAFVVGDVIAKESGFFDLWSVCQRKNVYFIKDECININREEKILTLEKYGKINYHLLSVETECKAFSLINEVSEKASLFENQNAEKLLIKLKLFLTEVHKHCPKEVRVVLTGLNQNSLDLAYFLNKKLQKSCEKIELIFICQDENSESLKKSLSKKIIRKLHDLNIQILFSQPIEKVTEHKIFFTNEPPLDFDVYIPFDQWQSTDSLGKLIQKEGHRIQVQRDLSLISEDSIFMTGLNVVFNKESLSVDSIIKEELIKVLAHNLFSADSEAPRLTCRNKVRSLEQRPYLQSENLLSFLSFKPKPSQVNEKLKEEMDLDLKNLSQISVLDISKKQLEEKLVFDSQHMSRPWQGMIEGKKENTTRTYNLVSGSGFNSFGSYTQSALKICEGALFKAITRGVKPERMRFSLTLPRDRDDLDHHIFEATFRAIEEFSQKNDIEIDGGDTFDGFHWQLSMTIGGKILAETAQKFSPHDYLIITRPLGFGFLWSNRLHNNFDSKWVEEVIESKVHISFEEWDQFVKEFNPSASVMIEEWGFLYHCLQSLPVNQQLMINFREVPRWRGIERVLTDSQSHPGLDLNWERIKDSVAFQRNEVSLNNSILWDPLSQGAVVVGVKAQDYKKALLALNKMGFKNSSLVGCIRPKNSKNRIVLSDWTP